MLEVGVVVGQRLNDGRVPDRGSGQEVKVNNVSPGAEGGFVRGPQVLGAWGTGWKSLNSLLSRCPSGRPVRPPFGP